MTIQRFMRRALLFLLPFIAYFGVAMYLDPFNVLRAETDPRRAELKDRIAPTINYPLYKLTQYARDPAPAVILGDSRAHRLRGAWFTDATGVETVNLAYGGTRLPELIDTFTEIRETPGLQAVYVGINFNLYNARNDGNRVPEAVAMRSELGSYLMSRYALRGAWHLTRALVLDAEVNLEAPPMSRDEFWAAELERFEAFYLQYEYPEAWHRELAAMSEFCRERGIRLVFFSPPTHTDLQAKLEEHGLGEELARFRADLEALGEYYDFDIPNEITRDRANFGDPAHYNDQTAEMVAREILSGDAPHARRF